MAENLDALSNDKLFDLYEEARMGRTRVSATDVRIVLIRRLAAKRPDPPIVTVERGRVPWGPAVDVFRVTLQAGGRAGESEWEESFGSEIETRAFLLGIDAGLNIVEMPGVVEPEIPREPTTVFSSEYSDSDISDLGEDTSDIPF